MKFYSLLLMALALILPSMASAKSVTFKTNLDKSAYITFAPSYEYLDVTVEGITVDLAADAGVNVSANEGYVITKVRNQESLTLDNSYISSSEMLDGDVITITTKEKQVRSLKVVADASQCYLSYDYKAYHAEEQVDGAWSFTNVSDYASVNIYSNNGYAISKVVDGNNVERDLSSPQAFYISGSSWEGELVLNVSTYNLDEARDKSVTIKVDGDPSMVKIGRKNYSQTLTPTENEFVFKYMDSELPLTIEHANYNLSLFKVSLNDTPVEKSGSYFYVSPADGDVITVQPESNVNVDLNFTYSSEDIIGVIEGVEVNGAKATWDKKKLTVKQGSKVYLDFNNIDYTDIVASVNGTPITFPTYGVYYEFSADDEAGYNFEISANAIAPYPVTIYCEDYDKVAVYNSSAYSLTEPIYLTQAETVINIPKSNNYVTVKPISSDYIVNLTVNGNALTSSYSPGQVSIEGDDVRIEVAVEKIARDMQMAVYLDEAEWIFDYCTVLLSNYKATEHKCFLQNGYQVINFGDFDNDIYFSFYGPGYTSPNIYRNGEKLSYLYSTTVADGDVFKAYVNEPETYAVTYDIEDGADAAVYHDIITRIDNPANHNVLSNTQIQIRPAADANVNVEINGTALTPGEDGNYTAYINADSNVKVSADGSAGIDNVTEDANAPVNVYNLQGIEVLHSASKAEINALPAGIYVAGGKKIVIR